MKRFKFLHIKKHKNQESDNMRKNVFIPILFILNFCFILKFHNLSMLNDI